MESIFFFYIGTWHQMWLPAAFAERFNMCPLTPTVMKYLTYFKRLSHGSHPVQPPILTRARALCLLVQTKKWGRGDVKKNLDLLNAKGRKVAHVSFYSHCHLKNKLSHSLSFSLILWVRGYVLYNCVACLRSCEVLKVSNAVSVSVLIPFL